MMHIGRHAIVPILIAASVLAAAAPPGAAAVPTATAMAAALTNNCAPYPGGTTICSAQPLSFDGSPLDVDVTVPM